MSSLLFKLGFAYIFKFFLKLIVMILATKFSFVFFCTWKPLTGQVVDVPVNFDLQRRNKVRDKIEQHTIAKLPSSPDSCFGTYLDCMNLTHRY